MNQKVIDILFSILVFSLPFKYIPKLFWQTFLGGPFGQDLVVYPLLMGFVYTFYCQWKHRNVLYKWDIFKKFVCAYLVVLFISLVWGLFNYPYYEQILNGPADQVEKLPGVLAFLHSVGISISEKTLLEFWMFARPIKGVFFEAFYTFGAAYMIFCWYHERVSRAVDILLKVTTVDLIIIAGYGLVDVCYQNGQMWAQNVLMAVNPILHGGVVLKPVYFGFAPRFFWDSQIRSIFLEPSYFGIYMAFAFPLLWWTIFRENKRWKQAILWLLFTVLAFEIFLTQSRTALAVNLGVFAIFALLCLYRLQKKLLILLAVLLIGCGIGFAGSLEFMKTGQVPSQIGEWTPLATKWQNMQKKAMPASHVDAKKVQASKGNAGVDSKKYLDSNLKSLSGAKIEGAHAGSNHSRFTVQKTHIIIGLEHPLFGVGTTLRNGYLREKLDKDPGAEIQKWNKNIDELGLLRGGFALLGDYSLRFAETGFLGLGLYLFPSLILMWTFGKVLIKRRGEASSVFVALSFVGIMATGLGDGINITFCYWMAMALSFLMLGDGDEEYTPLLWFLDPDTERGKYVCQQKISSMQGKFYKIFAWIRKWKNYGVLLKKIVSLCVISLCISEATLYGFEFINSRLGWALDIKSTDFLTIVAAGISVAGVLLALYGSNIAAVFSSRYSRAPSEVFNLFMSNFIINAGVKAVLYYIVYSFCFIYRLWKVPETSYLLTGIWYFFTLAMILIFAQLGLKSLILTDAFKLLRSEYNEAFSSLELLWNRNPLVRGKNVTLVRETLMQNLKTMRIVEGNALSSGDFSCPSLLTFMCNNISLLWRYMEIKHTFPFDSPWFPPKLVNPKWYEMPGYQKRIAVQLGGGVQPKQERDSFFIEELIESINLRGISKLSQDANMNYRRAYFQYLGRSLITGFNLGEYKFIANSIATIQKEWVHDWSKSEKKESAIIMVEDISYLYVSTLLGVLQKVQTIDVDKIIDYVASCTKFNDIDFQKSPFSNTQECRQFMERIAAEQIIEGSVLTPRWFIKQFHAKNIFLKMDKIERDTALTGLFQMGQLSDFAYAKKNYIAFIYLLIRMQEYHVKWASLIEKIEACKSSCQKYYVDKETYPWNENDDNLNELWLQTLAIMDERRLTALNQLLLDYDEHALWLQKNMDILGSQFAMLNEWMIDRITQNDKNTFEQSYHIYKKTAILYSQVIGRTIESTGSNVIWQLDQINHPLVDLIVISGYALLWGEVTGDDSWKEILVNSSELKQDKDLLKAFILWRSYSTVEIDELRFEWKRKMEVAVENLLVFEKTCNQNGLSKITDEKRNLIFNRCIGGMHGNCDINSNAVCDLYPVMLLNMAVPLEKRYKSRYWTAEEV